MATSWIALWAPVVTMIWSGEVGTPEAAYRAAIEARSGRLPMRS